MLFIGDSAAAPQYEGIPGVGGQATGSFTRWAAPAPTSADNAIVGMQSFDSGASLLFPWVCAFVTPTGTPVDPIVAAARAWQIPTVLGLGDHYGRLVEGVQTTVSGERGKVEQ